MYTNNADKLNDDYTTVVVRKGGKLEFDISAPIKGSILRYIITFIKRLHSKFFLKSTMIHAAGNSEAKVMTLNLGF